MMKIFLSLSACLFTVLAGFAAAGTMPEYAAAEAYKHIGETVRLIGMVDCIGNGRRHTDVEIGGCLPHTLLWVVVPNDASGPEIDLWKLRGVTIAATGKIESSGGIPQIVVESTTQIVPRAPPDPNYLASAEQKKDTGDLNGAISDLDQQVEQTHDPGVYIERAGLKEKKGDLAGAIRDYDGVIERSGDTNPVSRAEYYDSRAKLKIKNADLDGAIADADAAIRLNPRVPWHYATRGQADEAKGDFAAAVKDYQMAIKTEPHNSAYKDMLRRAQAASAKKPKAAHATEETLSKEKDLKSENGNVKTQITFVNHSKQAVKVYWLDYSGERVLYKKVESFGVLHSGYLHDTSLVNHRPS